MTKIQDALRELREQEAAQHGHEVTGELNQVSKDEHQDDGSENPTPIKEKPRSDPPDLGPPQLSVFSPKHAVDRDHLIGLGLLPTLDQAATIADEFRLIKRPLLENATQRFGSQSDESSVIMVASALPGAGKTFCSVNLAASIAVERDLNVLLVDADVAKPHISNALGLESRPGLIDVLADDSISIEEVLVRTDFNNIQVLPAGQRHSHSTELLASDRMSRVLTELATRYTDRIIIMDSPPLLATSEAQALAQKVGQIALVVEFGNTLQTEVREAIGTLDSSKPINVILNKCFYFGSGGYYGGRYGGRYGGYYGGRYGQDGFDSDEK